MKPLRIIGGTWRGKKLLQPPLEVTRPTTDRNRETLFNLLENAQWREQWHGLKDARVLDGYAGSGALGLEALSRGAGHVTFVDNSKKAIVCIQNNLERCQVTEEQAALKQADLLRLKAMQPADLIFLDPPYDHGDKLHKITSALIANQWTVKDTLFVIESEQEVSVSGLTLLDTRRYGRTIFSFLLV